MSVNKNCGTGLVNTNWALGPLKGQDFQTQLGLGPGPGTRKHNTLNIEQKQAQNLAVFETNLSNMQCNDTAEISPTLKNFTTR